MIDETLTKLETNNLCKQPNSSGKKLSYLSDNVTHWIPFFNEKELLLYCNIFLQMTYSFSNATIA